MAKAAWISCHRRGRFAHDSQPNIFLASIHEFLGEIAAQPSDDLVVAVFSSIVSWVMAEHWALGRYSRGFEGIWEPVFHKLFYELPNVRLCKQILHDQHSVQEHSL